MPFKCHEINIAISKAVIAIVMKQQSGSLTQKSILRQFAPTNDTSFPITSNKFFFGQILQVLVFFPFFLLAFILFLFLFLLFVPSFYCEIYNWFIFTF